MLANVLWAALCSSRGKPRAGAGSCPQRGLRPLEGTLELGQVSKCHGVDAAWCQELLPTAAQNTSLHVFGAPGSPSSASGPKRLFQNGEAHGSELTILAYYHMSAVVPETKTGKRWEGVTLAGKPWILEQVPRASSHPF